MYIREYIYIYIHIYIYTYIYIYTHIYMYTYRCKVACLLWLEAGRGRDRQSLLAELGPPQRFGMGSRTRERNTAELKNTTGIPYMT